MRSAFGDVDSSNLDAFENLVAADSVDHDPAPAQGPGPRFQDGKLVEGWGSSDELGMLSQLCLVSP